MAYTFYNLREARQAVEEYKELLKKKYGRRE